MEPHVEQITTANLGEVMGGLRRYFSEPQVKTALDVGKAAFNSWFRPLGGDLTARGAWLAYRGR